MLTQDPCYRFGPYTLEPADHRLLRGQDEVALRPKTFETLLFLVQRHGHAVRKDELLDAVWAETHVSEAVLTHCIAEVRQALGDNMSSPRFVRTLPRVGYKFIAAVETADPLRAAAPVLQAETAPVSTIAVLPFANLSADPGNEFFCDGLSEELINGLTRLRELRVVAHSSSFSFKGRNLDVREIGRRLGVKSILEGSVRKSGDRLRISVQLIDTAAGYHLWSEQYDRRLEDVFAVQDEIARAILDALKVELLHASRLPLVKPSTRSMDAYLLYLQGRSFWHQRFAGFLQKAMACFGQALEKDAGFALAYSGLADSYASLGAWAFQPAHEVFPQAAALARKGLELDPESAEAHASQAFVHMFYDWAWPAAEREMARALELNPGSALIHLWFGHLLSILGRFEPAIREVKYAQELDPLSPVVSANVGWTYYLARQQDHAIAELLQVLGLTPRNAMALLYLGFAYAAVGRYADAIQSFRGACEATPGMPWAAESIGWVHGLAGRRDEASQVLRDSLARMTTAYIPWSAIACIHLGLGEDDAVLERLTRGLEERDALMPWLMSMPAFDRLHTDPRFGRLMQRIGLA